MASELPYTQPGSPYTRPFRRVTLVQEDPFISENERVAIETAQNTKRNSQVSKYYISLTGNIRMKKLTSFFSRLANVRYELSGNFKTDESR